MIVYTPRDWYWIVGGNGPHIPVEGGDFTGDETRRFSSAANRYVPDTDAAYVQWRTAREASLGFDPTTRIDTEANLTAVLAEFGIVPDFGDGTVEEETSAVLTSGGFNDEELAGLVADLSSNGTAWMGFDVTVDGTKRTVRQQFGAVASAYDICTRINAILGPYAVTTMPADAAPWQFLITSNTTGVGSTISYATNPSAIAQAEQEEEAGPLKATADISIRMRLTSDLASGITPGTGSA
jgi:hypothetical protein